ncbi:hypothetical protein Tco_1576766 [Tanacetum coccineum]
MTTSFGSTPFLVQPPFRGILIRMSSKTLFQKMDLLMFIHVADPTKVKIVERELVEGKVKLLDSTVGRVVSFIPFAPACAKSKLEASVEKLFDEGGSTEQGDSAAGGGHDAEIKLVMAVEYTTAGNVTTERPKRPRKKRPAAVIGGESPSLLASSILSAKAGVLAMPTLPFVTSSVSATLESEGGAPLDSVTGANLRTIGLAVRFVISLDSSHHSSTNASGAEVDSVIRSAVLPSATTEAVITTSIVSVPPIPVPRDTDKVIPQVQQFIFHESSSGDTIKPDPTGPSHPPRKELSLGSRKVDSKNYHEVFIRH